MLTLTLAAFEVVTVHDGDTITIRYEGTAQRVRFRGIDTPELWKPRCRREAELAARARAFVRARLRAARTVTLAEVDTRSDPYGRWLASVYVDGQSLAAMTIQAGLGRPTIAFFIGRQHHAKTNGLCAHHAADLPRQRARCKNRSSRARCSMP